MWQTFGTAFITLISTDLPDSLPRVYWIGSTDVSPLCMCWSSQTLALHLSKHFPNNSGVYGTSAYAKLKHHIRSYWHIVSCLLAQRARLQSRTLLQDSYNYQLQAKLSACVLQGFVEYTGAGYLFLPLLCSHHRSIKCQSILLHCTIWSWYSGRMVQVLAQSLHTLQDCLLT